MNAMNSISILGSGWLGLPLAKSVSKTFECVHLSTRSPEKALQLANANIIPYIIDIEKSSEQIQNFLRAKILIINITCKSLLAFKELAAEVEKSTVEQVLFISSTSVYPNDGGLCKENDLLTEETNLRKIEKLFMNNANFKCSVIRFAGLIGRKRHPGRFFVTGKSIKDGNAKVNLIHQVDCIGLIESLLAQQAWGEIFNGCADNHPTKQAYYTHMANLLGYPVPHCLLIDNGANKIICNDKAKQQLGYQFIYPDIYQVTC